MPFWLILRTQVQIFCKILNLVSNYDTDQRSTCCRCMIINQNDLQKILSRGNQRQWRRLAPTMWKRKPSRCEMSRIRVLSDRSLLKCVQLTTGNEIPSAWLLAFEKKAMAKSRSRDFLYRMEFRLNAGRYIGHLSPSTALICMCVLNILRGVWLKLWLKGELEDHLRLQETAFVCVLWD